MKKDLYNHTERWNNWYSQARTVGIEGISKKNAETILHYLRDMSIGKNIGKKCGHEGPRSPARLNTLRSRMLFFAKQFKARYNSDDLTKLTDDHVLEFFKDLDNGTIKSARGRTFKSITTEARIFKAFWHWHQRVNRKKGISIPDITIDLGSFSKIPPWVYLEELKVQMLLAACRFDYRTLFTFDVDSGARPPGESRNILVRDLAKSYESLHIRDEIAKKGSFGRHIKLMLCRNLLKQYIGINGLGPDDYLFDMKSSATNKYLKERTVELFGKGVTAAGKRYSDIREYDLRHMSACYWVVRYRSERALMYRMGWEKSERIKYYTGFLGMRDTITEEDMLTDVTKTEVERKMDELERANKIIQEEQKAAKQTLAKLNVETNIAIKKLKMLKEELSH